MFDLSLEVLRVVEEAAVAPARNIVFAASGVTDGNLLKGVRFFGDGTRTQSIVMPHVPVRVKVRFR